MRESKSTLGFSFYRLPDDADPQSPAIWEKPPLPNDPEARARRIRIEKAIFDIAFGTSTDPTAPRPFHPVPDRIVTLMSPGMRAEYEHRLARAEHAHAIQCE